MSLEVHNEAIYGKTLGTISSFLGGRLFVRASVKTGTSAFRTTALSWNRMTSYLWYVQKKIQMPL